MINWPAAYLLFISHHNTQISITPFRKKDQIQWIFIACRPVEENIYAWWRQCPIKKSPIYCKTGFPDLIIVVTKHTKSELVWYKTVQSVEKHTAALYSQTCQDLLLAFKIWSYGSKHDSEVKTYLWKRNPQSKYIKSVRRLKYSFQYLSLFFFFFFFFSITESLFFFFSFTF